MSCPKCGHSSMSGPKYHQDFGSLEGISSGKKEYLCYTCMNCGYQEKKPTMDSLDEGSRKAHELYKKLKEGK